MNKEWTDAWLAYQPIERASRKQFIVSCDFEGAITDNLMAELRLAMKSLYQAEVLAGTCEQADLCICRLPELAAEGYRAKAEGGRCRIESSDDKGALYAAFAFLRQLQMQHCLPEKLVWEEDAVPSNPYRMLNHWDNIDGSIERGYSGESFYFQDDQVLGGERIRDFARMAASVGINGIVLNNVNVKGAAIELITERYFRQVRAIMETFAGYGIQTFLCVEFSAPVFIGNLSTADPCDEQVKEWWKKKAAEIWKNLPGFGGFMVKADSEGRPGPYTYGRNHAEGANMLADAVAPFGGIVIWRCFVYNCQQDWRDKTQDRACAGYDHYHKLDGQFRDNVILQIKNGPMDFQVREPVSPLFGGLPHTNMMLEVQIAQEYTGQQKHVCYLIPWFRQVLDLDLYCAEGPSTVADLVSTRTYGNKLGGFAAVSNTGNDKNWTGHDLAAANLYGFGRLAYNTKLDGEVIAREWARLTFGQCKPVEDTMVDILMKSWPAYEAYNAPLGIGWMCNPSHHYGPNVDGYEYDRWGTYHRADWRGIGVDRTETGSNYVSQYYEPLRSTYASLDTCPEELVLFFHHLAYDYVLKSGETVLQHIYNTHFEGAEVAASFVTAIEEIRELMDPETYDRIHQRLLLQKDHACEWRDVINTYFYRRTGIEDAYGRKIYN